MQQSNFYALGGTSASDMWATGESGTVTHWTGSAWSLVASGTTNDLTGLYVAGSSSLVVVPFDTVESPRRYDGSSWTPLPFPSPQKSWTRAADGRSASDVYVVDQSGTIRHWNGSAWSVTQPTTAALRSVYAAPAGEAWAMGPATLVHLAP